MRFMIFLTKGNIVSLIIGLAVTAIMISFVELEKPVDTQKIVASRYDILPGDILNDNNIYLIDWPSKYLPNNYFLKKETVLNRVSNFRLSPNQPITEMILSPIGSKAGLESQITLGMRAITVRVNDVAGVAGFALPGSFVDVIANIRDSKNNTTSKTVLTNVKVLAIAQDTNTESNKPKVTKAVTLELSSKQAEILDLARSIGTLSLALRNSLDKTDLDYSTGITLNELISQKNNQIANKKNKQKSKQNISPKESVKEIRNLNITSGKEF